jgi:GAF domain-containing protein
MSDTLLTHTRTEIARAHVHIDKLLDSGTPLHDTLEELVRTVESLSPSGMLASILILDGNHLRHGGAPSLPNEYNAAIDGIEIGPQVGSCGTAAFNNTEVNVYDIANDARWANYKELALQHGLRACWSTPIHSADGRILGTFANYYRVVRDPSPVDRELTQLITHSAAAAIERDRGAAAS